MRQILLLFIVSLFSCKKNTSNEIIYSQWVITNVEGANSSIVNQTIPLIVYWPYTSSSCDILDKFEESKQGNVISIKAYGHSTGGICTADAGVKTKIYNFISSSTGTFELKFLNTDSSYISHLITIN